MVDKDKVSTTHSAHQPDNASTHVAPQSGYTISTPAVVPSSGYQTLQGYSHLGCESTIPSSSASQCNSLDTSSGSIGLSNLHLESNGSEPNTPTTQHSDAHGHQPGNRDNFRRLLTSECGMANIILKCIETHYNGVYPNRSLIPLNTQGQMFNEFKMAHTSKKGDSLHTGGAISQVTRKEKMLGRLVAITEMFKVIHVKKSTNPTEEERWIEPRAQETYVRTPFKLIFFSYPCIYYILIHRVLCLNYKIGIYEYLRNIVVLYLLRVKTDHLHKKKTRIFGNRVLVNRLKVQSMAIQKRRIKRRSLGIVVHHPQALMAGIERQYLQWRREKERRKREEEIAAAKEVENKRYAALQAQLTFLFESGNILPPCSASSDGSDQDGEENDKSDKESEGDENGKSDKESENNEE
ncbi:hypothetical protein H5410_019655 [Solanum commersonii]|uniref:Uncharacterized protein n=1 Tax=Solanum commersonii TaxID=4109 RepID=A0A9J5ZBT8_SOLCO|nr:hypothetical protein H5410_019655 [Solanum commersonii]